MAVVTYVECDRCKARFNESEISDKMKPFLGYDLCNHCYKYVTDACVSMITNEKRTPKQVEVEMRLNECREAAKKQTMPKKEDIKVTEEMLNNLEKKVAESVQPSKRGGDRMHTIDWDKACALKLAGWKNKDIAPEVHATVGTINALIYAKVEDYKLRKELEKENKKKDPEFDFTWKEKPNV